MSTWIDFTRRNDPVCKEAHMRLRHKMGTEQFPEVLCFWTKNPAGLWNMYHREMEILIADSCIVLVQTTINPGYQAKLEPSVDAEFWEMEKLVETLGSPQHIRGRFDPIIPGFTDFDMFVTHCTILKEYGITDTTVNFINPEYKDARAALATAGVGVESRTDDEKRSTLEEIVSIGREHDVAVHVCAETARFSGNVSGLRIASCSDPTWPEQLGYTGLEFKNRASRTGCGCCYSGDWGQYESGGGWKCPHQCVYCYAKKV